MPKMRFPRQPFHFSLRQRHNPPRRGISIIHSESINATPPTSSRFTPSTRHPSSPKPLKLASFRADKEKLKSTIEKLQSEAKHSGDTDMMIARAVTLQEQLRNSEALHQSLVETLPFFIFRKDLEGRFLFVNDRFCKHFSLAKDQI